MVMEAKIAKGDGTARDKVTRVQHLGELSRQGQRPGTFKYEVVACIGGRGFGIRREDMKKLLLATRGRVFTLKTWIGAWNARLSGSFGRVAPPPQPPVEEPGET